MKADNRKGIEEARRNFAALVERAARGEPTIITKHGKPHAALVAAAAVDTAPVTLDIRSLRGSGRGLWGRSGVRALRAMRDEWR
jgi:prevent-host-death family protein